MFAKIGPKSQRNCRGETQKLQSGCQLCGELGLRKREISTNLGKEENQVNGLLNQLWSTCADRTTSIREMGTAEV